MSTPTFAPDVTPAPTLEHYAPGHGERIAFIEGALRAARDRFDATDVRITALEADICKLRDLLERSVDNTTRTLELFLPVFTMLGVPLPPEATCPDTPASETPPT